MVCKQQAATTKDELTFEPKLGVPGFREAHEHPASVARLVRKLRLMFVVIAPWLVIGSLIYIAFFTHPGSIIRPPPSAPIAQGDRFYGATSTGDNTVWLVGSFGKIIKSSDTGHSWAIQSSPTQSNLQSVVAWNKEDALAVGDNSTVIRTSDGGLHWSVVPGVPQASSEFNKLLKATISSDGAVWVVGEEGTVLLSRDEGKVWTRVAPTQDITFGGVATAAGTVWVVGEFGTILVSHDDGATWSKQAAGTDSTLTAVTFGDADEGVAVGLDGTVLVTHDGGANWGPAAMPRTTAQFYSIGYSKEGWLASGDNGMFATASLASETWSLHSLGESDFSWYVEALSIDKGQQWLLVGSGVRLLEAGHWDTMRSTNGRHP